MVRGEFYSDIRFVKRLKFNFSLIKNTKIMKPKDDYDYTKDDLDNHSDQLNPNNDAYWQSRGEEERPEDWEDRVEEDDD